MDLLSYFDRNAKSSHPKWLLTLFAYYIKTNTYSFAFFARLYIVLAALARTGNRALKGTIVLSRIGTLFQGSTIESRLKAAQNRPSGFDYMRLILATGVIVWHSELICYGGPTDNAMWKSVRPFLSPFFMLIVPMFFSLSGFLVASSLERCKSLITFLGLRCFRIMPALSLEVILSAFILGPLLTALPLDEYFVSPMLRSYFLNIIGEIHYFLPGVFEQNPISRVNGQLWTVPYELVCYVVLAGLTVIGAYKKPMWMVYAMGLCYVLQIFNTIYRPRADAIDTGSTVVMSFLAGILIYRYRDKIRHSSSAFWLLSILTLALLAYSNGMRFAALPIDYLTVYLGLMTPRRTQLILSGDYSYGIYLYGFPIQQAYVALDPIFKTWYWNLAAVLPTVFAFAALSWWLVEKPVMNRRLVLVKIENWFINRSVVRLSKPLRFFSGLYAMNSEYAKPARENEQ